MSTTLEILAPYLPYGIRVASQWTDGSNNTTGVLLGIDMSVESPVIWRDGEHDFRSSYANVLPVLRSFEDLQKETVFSRPILKELAQLFVGERVPIIAGPYIYADCIDEILGSVTVTISTREDDRLECTIWSDGTGEVDGQPLQLSDYLRSKHFAVGLEPHQFIRKTE